MANPPRIWISNETPAAGEILTVRAQVEHVMENGLRLDAAGNPIPRDTLNRVSVRLGEAEILSWTPETAVAQNPYIEFTFRASASGTLTLTWEDMTGVLAEVERQITLA